MIGFEEADSPAVDTVLRDVVRCVRQNHTT